MSNMYIVQLLSNMYNLVNMEKALETTFAARLRDSRIANGQTQQAAADSFGISLRGYCRWEKGEREPTFSTLVAIADLYGVSVDWLLGRTDEARAGE